ncbi:MAG: uracil-DNA glycosylase [Flavobacteriaceae bacterium TMED120]|nr:MAG: uracil-DNA glycosylase [Flavobacteriaceae bacterium TMED120]HCQ24543.1 uracil-DNA glycosylase [Flavobacteriaceae bacterium]|tara:strand:- start:4521 stop:5186 length:666 start_codon:yes stop_codon:yes gene_type:complete
MPVRIHPSWEKVFHDIFKSSEFHALIQFVRQDYNSNACYPPGKQIFAAFDLCPWEKVQVVVLGQDPYHGAGQAHGLCFSVPDGIPHPPSLINIFKELETDIGKNYPQNGDLTAWAQQGVLLLNATLTVRAHQAGSHQGKGWERFTDSVIQKLSEEKKGLVFLLWGGYAKKKIPLIDAQKHLILSSGHPSPLSANRGFWFGNRHFSQCNAYLLSRGHVPIEW